MREGHIAVETLGPVGALITDIDVSQPLSVPVLDAVREAWRAHKLLVFPNQSLTPAQQARFAEYFGELDIYPFMPALEAHANVIPVIKEPNDAFNFGGGWHTDTSYLPCPPRATLLYAVDVPQSGGDTLFANTAAAFKGLSEGLQTFLRPLSGVFSPAIVHGAAGGQMHLAGSSMDHHNAAVGAGDRVAGEVEHPLIRTHPETGEESIFCTTAHTLRISNMTRQESLPILEYLMMHATGDPYVTRLKWSNGMLALWDNRCLFHFALNDYPGERREMHRVIVKGESPA